MSENRGRKKEKERKEKVFSSKFFGIFTCLHAFNNSMFQISTTNKDKKIKKIS
jgi:hypothetical protein